MDQNHLNIQNRILQLRDKSKKLLIEIRKIDPDCFFQAIYLQWMKNSQEQFNQGNYDEDMGLIFFAYSLFLNPIIQDKEKIEDMKTLPKIIQEITDLYNEGKVIPFLPQTDNIKEVQKDGVFDHFQIIQNNRGIYGVPAYLYQLQEWIDQFFIKYFEKDFIKYKGYSPSILKVLLDKSFELTKKMQYTENIESLILSLLYMDTKLTDPKKLTDENIAEKYGITSNKELCEYYNNFINNFICKLGDNNYTLPSDETILVHKPFILHPSEPNKCVNPFFSRVGMPMAIKAWDRWAIDCLGVKYTKRKASFIETKAHQLLADIFGKENCYLNKYYKREDGILCETDVLVQYGSFILYFECKSNTISKSSNKRSENLYNNLNDFIGDAGQQIHNIEKKFNTTEFKLYDSDKPDSSKYTLLQSEGFIFLPIIITFTPFEFLSGQSQNLKDVLNKWSNGIQTIPLIMTIFELEILTKLLDSPHIFTDYILQRLNAVNTPNNPFLGQYGADELVQLGWYIEKKQIPFFIFKHSDANALFIDSSSQNNIDLFFGDVISNSVEATKKKPTVCFDAIPSEFISWIQTTNRIPKKEKPNIIQWALALFQLKYEDESLETFIERNYRELNSMETSEDKYFTRAGLLKSKYSQSESEPTMLFSFSVPKSHLIHGKCNMDYVGKKYEESKSLIEYFAISYNILATAVDDRFDIFVCLPRCNPYDYFDIPRK